MRSRRNGRPPGPARRPRRGSGICPDEALEAAFGSAVRWARGRYPKLPPIRFRVGHGKVLSARRAGNPRAFFCAANPSVGTVQEALALPVGHLVGIMLHEIGHIIAWREWRRGDEPAADMAVRRFLGVPIRYRGPLMLQWVPPSVVKRVLAR